MEIVRIRSIQVFKKENNISNLYIRKSVRRGKNGDSVLKEQKYADGTTKYFAQGDYKNVYLPLEKEVCEDMDKNQLRIDNLIVADVQQSDGEIVSVLMYSGQTNRNTQETQLFQIHPHHGYLNSEIKIANANHGECIKVKDSFNDKEYELAPASTTTIKLDAGEHVFSTIGGGFSDKVSIEDAIRLGGSKEKNTYVFEGTPWVLIVMLDRIYFFNRETNEQFVENNITPTHITFLSKDYLLFISNNNCSIFNLNKLSVEKTYRDSTFLFSNGSYAIIACPKKVVLYNLDSNSPEESIELLCNAYALDKQNEYLYYYDIQRDRVIRRLLNASANEDVTNIQGKFRCFIGNHSVVLGSDCYNLSILDMQTGGTYCIVNKSAIPVSRINNTNISTIENFTPDYLEIDVVERENRWLIIETQVHTSMNNDGSLTHSYSYYVIVSNIPGYILESDCKLSITEGKYCDYVSDTKDRGAIILEDSFQKMNGVPIVSPTGYMLIKNGYELFDPLNSVTYGELQGNNVDLFRNTGFIIEPNENTTPDDRSIIIDTLIDVEHKKSFPGYCIENVPKVEAYRLSEGKNIDDLHSFNGLKCTMPCAADRLLAISEGYKYAVILDEIGMKILHYDSDNEKWVSYPMGEIHIDKTTYADALFCSDNKNVVFKKGNDYYMRNLDTGEEQLFQTQGSVVRKTSINGYLPYFNFDSHFRPVLVDPVTLNRVEYAATSHFTFQSLDGTIQHISHNYLYYYSNEDQGYVTEYKYQLRMMELDYFETDSEEVKARKIENRKQYLINNPWINYSLSSFLKIDSVCDTVLFEKHYYIIERINNEIISIKQPEKFYFLNYVSYSYDNKYILYSGRYFKDSKKNRGFALLYDIQNKKFVDYSFFENQANPSLKELKLKAVWLGAFNKQGIVAFYDSYPHTYVLSDCHRDSSQAKTIENRSFLTFSPSGKYMALSSQGYIPYSPDDKNWGHQPSFDVYIAESTNPQEQLAHYRDHGDSIAGLGMIERRNISVASATFSQDERMLMTVSCDGVMVIRNLHLPK